MAAMTLTAICLHDLVIRRGETFRCKACGEPVKVKKNSKHHNKKITIDGYVFDSGGEGQRYMDLKFQQRAGLIRDLKVHPRFYFYVGCLRIFSYYADYKYFEVRAGQWIVEDYKGQRLPIYRLKKKLIEAQHKIRIVETGRKGAIYEMPNMSKLLE
jgi:hypothetical protein